jgi:hypothetical protein
MPLRPFIATVAFAALFPTCVTVAQGPAQTTVTASERFGFHSDPWINLHHFLYQWARLDLGLSMGRVPASMPERASLTQLSSDERRDWSRGLEFYRDSVAGRNHFDAEMLLLKRDLMNLAGDPLARPPDRIKGIAAALSSAMPVYERTWWPDHDQANRTWIAALMPRLQKHEAAFVHALLDSARLRELPGLEQLDFAPASALATRRPW